MSPESRALTGFVYVAQGARLAYRVPPTQEAPGSETLRLAANKIGILLEGACRGGGETGLGQGRDSLNPALGAPGVPP